MAALQRLFKGAQPHMHAGAPCMQDLLSRIQRHRDGWQHHRVGGILLQAPLSGSPGPSSGPGMDRPPWEHTRHCMPSPLTHDEEKVAYRQQPAESMS